MHIRQPLRKVGFQSLWHTEQPTPPISLGRRTTTPSDPRIKLNISLRYRARLYVNAEKFEQLEINAKDTESRLDIIASSTSKIFASIFFARYNL